MKKGLPLLILLFSVSSHAGKVDDVVTAVKEKCSKDLPKRVAAQSVKKAFLTCNPGTPVDIDGCKIDCLKKNEGSVIGN
ncbi:MAG: hypothetical protein CL675_06515 [Bdellovibrionaceae bacterium]|nr:hypothetical protein [Pseudobdellovibrionaceae bacterium]